MFKKLSGETINSIKILRARGVTIQRISEVLEVGRSSVMRYSTPGFYENKSNKRRQRRRDSQVFTTIDGKTSSYKIIGKRPRPEACEICNKVPKLLQWHHWDDSDLSKGVWACRYCHSFMEAIESGLNEEHVKKYIKFKEMIENVQDSNSLQLGKEAQEISPTSPYH